MVSEPNFDPRLSYFCLFPVLVLFISNLRLPSFKKKKKKKSHISIRRVGVVCFQVFFFSSILLHRALDPCNFLHVRKSQNCLIHKYMIRALVLTTARSKAYQSDSRSSRFPTIQACSFGSLCSGNSPSKDHRCKPASTSFGLFCC